MMIHLQCIGLLHSDICGSILACNSPQLFAAYRVLLRLPMPRHPPCALISLTFNTLFVYFWFGLCLSHFLRNFNCSNTTLSFALDILLIFSSLHYFCFIQFSRCFFVILSNHQWAQVDSNHRPHAYQACALTT